MSQFNFNFRGDMLCVRCGAAIAASDVCHACEYVQDAIYETWPTKELLSRSDYQLSLLFFPHLMISNFRLFPDYAKEIRAKLVSFTGRHDLENLTIGREDGWVFCAKV